MDWIRRNRKGAAAVLAAVVLVVLIGRFVKQYQDAGPAAAAPDAPAAGSDPSMSAPFDPHSVTDRSPEHFFPESGATTLPRTTVVPAGPNGSSVGRASRHTLVLTVTSVGTIPRLGYIVPTSPDSSKGDVKNPGRQWSLTTTVVGRPEYAAVFVQAGATGTPITCRVSVDGVTKDTKTTSSPYGRAVCLG